MRLFKKIRSPKVAKKEEGCIPKEELLEEVTPEETVFAVSA
jgi:hypothetical protein